MNARKRKAQITKNKSSKYVNKNKKTNQAIIVTQQGI